MWKLENSYSGTFDEIVLSNEVFSESLIVCERVRIQIASDLKKKKKGSQEYMME
jgi:hypothetical protein